MNKNSIRNAERLAYHEAGHAVMAIEQKIEVYELAIPNATASRRSRFALLGDLYNLRSPNWPEIRLAADRYVLFRLAGPAAEWRRLEKHHDLLPGSPGQVRLRQRFRRDRVDNSQVDFDASYAYLTAWMFLEDAADAERLLDRYWSRVCGAWDFALMWKAVERVADALLERGRLTNAEVRALYKGGTN
jgi:hypothetical protein